MANIKELSSQRVDFRLIGNFRFQLAGQCILQEVALVPKADTGHVPSVSIVWILFSQLHVVFVGLIPVLPSKRQIGQLASPGLPVWVFGLITLIPQTEDVEHQEQASKRKGQNHTIPQNTFQSQGSVSIAQSLEVLPRMFSL